LNLYLHDVLSEWRNRPRRDGPAKGERMIGQPRRRTDGEQLAGGQGLIRLRNSLRQQVLGGMTPLRTRPSASTFSTSGRSDANAPGRPASRRRR
jgi:hypothetical protein